MSTGALVPVVVWLLALAAALPGALWRLRHQPLTGPALAITLMLVLWQLSIPTLPGLPVHLLGVTAAALICGPSLAFFQVSLLSVLDLVFHGDQTLAATATMALIAGALPAFLTASGVRLARRYLPANVFIFIFVNACAVSAIGMGLFVMARELLLFPEGSFSRAVELAILLPLPEAIVTGTVIAPLVAFRGSLVQCFDATRYFGPNNS